MGSALLLGPGIRGFGANNIPMGRLLPADRTGAALLFGSEGPNLQCLPLGRVLLLLLGGEFNLKRSPAGWMLPVGCVGAALASAKMLQIVLMLSAGVMGDVVTYCLAQRASNHKRDICCIPVV